MILNIGQFYLEKIRYPFDIPEAERCTLKYSNTNELVNSFLGNYTLSCKNKYKIIMLVSKRANETGLTQNVKEILKNGEDITYQYDCSVPLEYFKKHNIKDVSFEVAWVQENQKDGKQCRLFTGNIPLIPQ